MAGDKWHCSKCTFLHLFPAQRCTMCNALRVSKEEMRNFVQGKSSLQKSIRGSAESRHDGTVQQSQSDNAAGGSDGNDAVNGRRNIPQHHQARLNNNGAVAFQPQMALNRPNNSQHHQNRAVVINPYAKKTASSRPTSSSSHNQSSTASSNSSNNDCNGQQSIQNSNMTMNSSDQANQLKRPPTANPYGNNRSTTVNVSGWNNDSTNRNGYRSSNENLQQQQQQRNSHVQQQQQRNNQMQQHQQRSAVNNPYNKSMNSASTVAQHSNATMPNVQISNAAAVASRQYPQHQAAESRQQAAHSNAPIHNIQSLNTAMPSRQYPQQQAAESRQQAANVNNSNATSNNNTRNATNSQQNNTQNLHRFFTGGRPATAFAQQPSQRPQPQVQTSTSYSGQHHRNSNNTNVSSSSLPNNNNNRQRLSLSAKKQLPYTQGPVQLCPATCHNWIYPTDDKYPERTYQLEMSESAILYNTLVSLPTGLGKTLIAAVVMYNYYRWFPEGKVVFCAPTRPLVTQQIQACYNIMGIPERHTAEISGRVANTSRKSMWDTKRVFFCTPQTLVKDIEEDRCDASKIVCVVMDEAHRATGMHTFALLPNMIEEAGAKFRLVALSATPGTDIKSIQAVVETLKISKIEARTEDDPNVKRYIHNREEEVISVKQPDVIKILDKKLLEFVRQPLERLRSVNAATRLMGDSANLSPYAVMRAQEDYIQRTGDHRMYHTFQALRSLVDVRINLKNHGVQYALQNIARKEMEARGPLRAIFHSEEFKALKAEMQTAAGDPTECLSKNNPKYEKLTEVLLEHFQRKKAWGESTRVIVFSQLRESVMGIVSMLSSQNATLLKPTPFVGQSRKKESESNPGQEVAGMNQAEQQRILRQFNEGVFNILVCTCVGEEGLDIGDVDLIVNFDILKSAIRSIQRTGRTGRKRNGRVIFLVSEGQEERSYRDSVTNSKKIARALKDPSVFRLCPNSPMFPDEPALLRQKMVVNDFHMSQVGGHTPKTRGRGKAGRSSKRNGDKVTAMDDSWTLNQAQQRERMHLFGNLSYSSHSAYETETMQGHFPASLRKKYLKARRRPQQARDYTGRGRSSKVLACVEKLYTRPTERTESRSTPKKSSLDCGDDDMNSTPKKSSFQNGDDGISSVGNSNHSVTFDVESDCGFAEDPFKESSEVIISGGDDLIRNGCNEVSPESNCKDLGAIFGTLSVKHFDCLDFQQVANLFDSDDHKNCSVMAPPPFGDCQCDESSNLCDESSYFSSESSKQSLMSVNTMNDDELCAFFENSPLPTASQHKPASDKLHATTDDACNGDKSVDIEDEFNNDVDFSPSRDDIEPHEVKGSPYYSPNDPEASFGEKAELDSGVPSKESQNTSKHILNCAEVKNGQGDSIGVSTNVGANEGGSFVESDNRGCDDIDPERDEVNEGHSELLDAIGGSLSPIAPLSQVAAFHLPTPPPSSSDEDDSDDDSDGNKDVIAEESKTSNANGQDLGYYPPLGTDDARDHSTESEQNPFLGGIDAHAKEEEEEEENCKKKIDALQLPTQYSSSSDDDDDSEGGGSCGDDAYMQVVEPNDNAAVTNGVGNNEVIESEEKYAIGTKISKEFKDPKSGKLRLYRGEVRAFYSQDNQDKLYRVVFEDGDCEDMEEGEIENHLASNETQVVDTRISPAQQQSRSQMSPDDLTDTPVKAIVRTPAGANSRMSLDSLTDTPVVQRRLPVQNSLMSIDNLTDTPVVQRRMPTQNSRMSMDSLTDTPVVQCRILERKSRMSMDCLTDTPVQQQQLPERKRLKKTNDKPTGVSKPSEKLSKQERLKQRIEEKYRCKFLDTEAANDDSDSGDEEEEEDDDMSNDGFINDTSQLGYSQDDLDCLNESVEECHHEESDVLHRQLNHQQTANNQFKTPILNRRMQLMNNDQSQSSLPSSQRGLGNMNFIRSVIDHCRQGGNSDEIETEYHRLVGETSQDMPISQMEDDARVESQLLEQQPDADVRQPKRKPVHPGLAMTRNNANNNSSVRVGLGSQQIGTSVAAEKNVSNQSAPVAKKAPGLSAEQKAMIEAKRQAALRLRQQKQRQTMEHKQTQVRFNPYAK